MSMPDVRLFTIEEAENTLPLVRRIVGVLVDLSFQAHQVFQFAEPSSVPFPVIATFSCSKA